MLDKIVSIVAATVAFVVVAIACRLVLTHWPKRKLSPELVEKIKTYGLMHFTDQKNIEGIMQEGLMPGKIAPMSFLERNMVWLYIADPSSFDDKLKEVRSKGERSSYDAVIYFRGFTDKNICRMRYRANPEAVVHIGILKTDTMEAKVITTDSCYIKTDLR